MCKFSYRFTRVGEVGAAQQANTPTQANTADGTAWDGVSAVKTDAAGQCKTAGCLNWSVAGSEYGYGSNNVFSKNSNTIGDSYGDWAGTFYTHDKLPRVAKDFRTAIGRVANGYARYPTGPQIQLPMSNWAFYDQHDGNTASSDTPSSSGTTPPTQVDGLMTQANRLVFP